MCLLQPPYCPFLAPLLMKMIMNMCSWLKMMMAEMLQFQVQYLAETLEELSTVLFPAPVLAGKQLSLPLLARYNKHKNIVKKEKTN